jgi:hypothetical protein
MPHTPHGEGPAGHPIGIGIGDAGHDPTRGLQVPITRRSVRHVREHRDIVWILGAVRGNAHVDALASRETGPARSAQNWQRQSELAFQQLKDKGIWP